MSKQKLKAISGKLKKASKAHAGQAKQIDSVISAMPMKRGAAAPKKPVRKPFKPLTDEQKRERKMRRVLGVGQAKDIKAMKKQSALKKKTSPALAKLSASCKAAAKRKFKVYPSAYANMWASKTQKAGKCQMYTQSNNPFKKRMGKFKHSDAPDAKGKFKSLSPSSLASWMIKSRKGNLSRIISSLNQQVVFNRGKNPSYARKMKTTMNIVRKRLGKKKDE